MQVARPKRRSTMNFIIIIIVVVVVSLATPYLVECGPSSRSHKRRPMIKEGDDRSFHEVFAEHPRNRTGSCVHNLCMNVVDYPSNYIRDKMQEKKDFHRFFGSVIQPYRMPSLEAKSPGGGYVGEERNMCDTVQFTYFPQLALNRNRKRMMIVNVGDYKQAVTFETCMPKAKCFLSEHKPLGYETSCRQQYSLIRLVSMTENGSFTLDTFPVPSSCVCTYRRVLYYD